MKDLVDVSVIVPVRNGEAYVAQAIQSALDQDGASVEVLVVDDESTDHTRSIVRGFDHRVRLIALEKQPNHIRSTNIGISKASGTLISVLHHDDYFRPGKLAAHLALHRAHPSAGLSYSHQWYVDALGRRLASLRSPVAHHDYVVPGWIELQHLVVQNYINFANCFVPAAVYRSVGAFDEGLWVSAEWDMWLRIARTWGVGYIADPLVCYRLHAASLTHAATGNTAAYHKQLTTVLDVLLLDDTLPAAVRARLPLSVANVHVSMAVLHALRGEWTSAVGSGMHAAASVAPWRWPQVVRSAALIPRVGARWRLRRSLRRK